MSNLTLIRFFLSFLLKFISELDDIKFAFTTKKAVLEHFKVDSTPAIVLIRNFDEEKRISYKGHMKAEGIKEFVNTNSLPHVIEFTVVRTEMME